MSDTGNTAQTTSGRRREVPWGTLGVLAALASPVAWTALTGVGTLGRTGLPLWVGSGLALLLAGVGAWRRPSKLTRGLAAATCLATATWAIAFFTLLRLPPAQLDTLTTAPDFTLPDEAGRDVALRDLRQAGPVLLVFYRGHW